MKRILIFFLSLAYSVNASCNKVIFCNEFYDVHEDYTITTHYPPMDKPEYLKPYKPFYLMNEHELGAYIDHYQRIVNVWNNDSSLCWLEIKNFMEKEGKEFKIRCYQMNPVTINHINFCGDRD